MGPRGAECGLACRVFKCERGLKQHTHMVHTLAAVKVKPRQRYRCGGCGAAFESRRGAQLHAAECQQGSLLYLRDTPGTGPAGAGAAAAATADPAAAEAAAAVSTRAEAAACAALTKPNAHHTSAEPDPVCASHACGPILAGVGAVRSGGLARGEGAGGTGGRSEVLQRVATGAGECAVCGLQFGSEAEAAAHRAWLAPREEAHRCGGCGRTFGDGRALQQHTAVCAAARAAAAEGGGTGAIGVVGGAGD